MDLDARVNSQVRIPPITPEEVRRIHEEMRPIIAKVNEETELYMARVEREAREYALRKVLEEAPCHRLEAWFRRQFYKA